MENNNVAIIIPSCDKYQDMRTLLCKSYNIFWSNCDYKKYIITNSNIKVPNWFTSLNIGVDVDWSSNLKKAIDLIPERYLLMHIDDLILTKTVNNQEIKNYIDNFIDINGNYVKLLRIRKKISKLFIESASQDWYRTSTVFSLWDKLILKKILISWESPRQFEVDGTERSKEYKSRYSADKNYFEFVNLAIKGKIERRSLGTIKRKWLLYTWSRNVMSYTENFIYIFKTFIYKIILILSNNISKFFIKIARKIG